MWLPRGGNESAIWLPRGGNGMARWSWPRGGIGVAATLMLALWSGVAAQTCWRRGGDVVAARWRWVVRVVATRWATWTGAWWSGVAAQTCGNRELEVAASNVRFEIFGSSGGVSPASRPAFSLMVATREPWGAGLGVAASQRQSGVDACTLVWRCGSDAVVMWWRCGWYTVALGRRCGGHAAAMGWQRGCGGDGAAATRWPWWTCAMARDTTRSARTRMSCSSKIRRWALGHSPRAALTPR